MTPRPMFPPPEFVIDTREQVRLYSWKTGELYDGDRTGFMYYKDRDVEFASAPNRERFVCESRGAYKFDGYATHREMLVCGDYALKGYEKECAPDRKTLSDFVITITVNHDRFISAIERARKLGIKLCVVVEGTYQQILREAYINPIHRLRLQISGSPGIRLVAIKGAMYRLNQLRIPVHFLGNRENARDFVEGMLLQTHADMNDAWRATQKF